MGLESRDYYRDGRYTGSLAGLGIEFTPVVKYLIITNIVVFLLQIFVTRNTPPELPEGFEASVEQQHALASRAKTGDQQPKNAEAEKAAREEMEETARKAKREMERMLSQMPGTRVSIVQEWLELDPEKTVKQGQVWRLLTGAFCHLRYSVWHILFNMLFLYWFGTRLEAMYGSREFLLFYLTAALCSSIAYLALAFHTGSAVPAIGASGAVMGVMMVYTIFYPLETFLVFLVVPVPLWILLSVYVLYDLHPVLLALAGDRVFSTVAHAGHLGGLLFGFVYWRLGLRLEAPFDWLSGLPRRPIRKPRTKQEPAVVSQAERTAFDDRVDDVLRKINEQGREALTDEELDILQKASEKYRGSRKG